MSSYKKIFGLLLTATLALGACGQADQKDASSEASSSAQTSQTSTQTPESGYPFTVQNELKGQTYEQTFDQSPERAVSLSGFTTEMLLALGLEDKMVGYAYQDNEVLPEYKEALSQVKELSDKNPSKEVLIASQPDFVTGWTSSFSDKNFPPQFLNDNQMKFYVPLSEAPNATMDTVYQDFQNFGRIFAVEDRANEVIEKMKAGIQPVVDKVKDKEPVTTFVYDSGEDAPLTASATLGTELIRLAGGKNVFAGGDKGYATVSWEDAVNKNPDTIIVIDYEQSTPIEEKLDYLKNKSPLKDSEAVKNNRITVIGLSDLMPGVRNVKAVEDLAQFFHPEAFANE
ncbi:MULTISPECIES: ABC transporter substrate-binding protein [Aerococcus]|uniref:ABC transporter substrate-binding protein n=1 Tax=Aerococcus TaxID=1375 RepID=UPI000DCE123A|nr:MULTISPECIES: ABC transporter substrate-binding protein [Aerococcus]KAA9233677.1 ABC transporter substrate-binding protein [Aerococcus mictus]MDK6375364.1 ABC transporter substrate-binding protein [Aerococcus urinae]MDK6421389.1 ABC transporter substrate-binding protein [Aerococcus urinae]MDK8075705.1 ABC transporter substrate-binding protein [Aerococcus urinae]MDK8084526.1 ABC transporter substrate-binding protein [Aerococcus urinae]